MALSLDSGMCANCGERARVVVTPAGWLCGACLLEAVITEDDLVVVPPDGVKCEACFDEQATLCENCSQTCTNCGDHDSDIYCHSCAIDYWLEDVEPECSECSRNADYILCQRHWEDAVEEEIVCAECGEPHGEVGALYCSGCAPTECQECGDYAEHRLCDRHFDDFERELFLAPTPDTTPDAITDDGQTFDMGDIQVRWGG